MLDDYLAVHGARLTSGYDIEDRCLLEMPEVVVSSIRAAADESSTASGSDGVDVVAALRERVPVEYRQEFDDVVEDARLSYGLRDENGPITYEWPAGILRHGLLEAGRRLHARQAMASPENVFELDIDEIVALLRGNAGPTAAEIAERADERRWWAGLVPPPRLGREEPPPPVSSMPPNLARITRIVLTVVGAMEAKPDGRALNGTGIGTEPYRGTARVVRDASEALVNVEPGDVIVAPYTAPTYNAVLAIAGAIVTEEGGMLSHAAVLARELGLPAVIGAANAMREIPDGATVEVDPGAGVVRVIS